MANEKVYNDFKFENSPQPFWIASTASTSFPKLDNDVNVDVAIVGGIVGITTAYLLKREGLKVAVIEADHILQATTGHTTAKLTSQHDLIYDKLIKHLGLERAKQYASANEHAIKFINELVKEKSIDCDFSTQSAYAYTLTDEFIEKIEKEVKVAIALGIEAEYADKIPLPFDVKAAEVFNNQAQFHPRKYLLALTKDIPGEGSYIFEQSRIVDLHEGNTFRLVSKEGKNVTAERVVIATHFPFYGANGFYFARMFPEKSYALGVRIKGKFQGGMYISVENPGRSLRSTPNNNEEIVIIGGEHHKTGEGTNTNSHYKNLIEFAKENYEVIDIPYRWSTQDYTTLDEVPYVGRITSKIENIYVATGFRKWGMTNGTASSILIKDLIINGHSPWEDVYDPSRFETVPVIKNFVKDNANVAKHLVGDKLKSVPKDIEINNGEARIIEKNDEKVGLYKDEKGKMHVVDITCTHMGCNLAWNAAELSWDCPCHGSRFTYDGDIIEGPALKSLRIDNNNKFNP